MIVRVAEHEQIKPELLKLIGEHSSTNQLSGTSVVHRTDWYTKDHKKYGDFIVPKLKPYFDILFNMAYNSHEQLYDIDSIELLNYRFNQYRQNGSMDWHRHPHSSWHVIYYVELSKNSPATEIQVPFTGEVIRPPVSEGDLIMCPSAYLHRSPTNEVSDRKTIVVFNFS